MSARVRYEVDAGVARVTLDAPERLNAVDPGMLEAVVAHVEAAGADPAVRVVAVTGAGQGKLSLKARGVNLQPPALPLALPLRAQLQGEHGICWETAFGAAGVQRNADGRFSARDLP